MLSRDRAGERAKDLHRRGRTLVFTNGCFDILHPGHVDLLRRCSELGDSLFVGLNTDGSVAGLKGEGRPVNPLESRAAVLEAVRWVDHVVPFSQPTPAELIELLQPDVLVKGGDYAPGEVVGRDTVEACGGRVVVVPLLPGYSTTGLLERIRSGS
ncbi:MAG: adenylyltransferase/cytidyltransferase family protein [Candidatus Fermentibacteraceae bacterium]